MSEARRVEVGFLSAAIAYYAFVSLVPMLLLGLAVGSVVGGPNLANAVVGATSTVLAPAGQELVRDALVGADPGQRGGATVAGLALLLWSGLRLFRGLDDAFRRIYGTRRSRLTAQVRDAFVLFLAITGGVAAAVLLGGVLPAVTVLGSVGTVLLPITLTVVFLPIYYFLPETDVSIREALPGTGVAAVGWWLLTEVFRVYAANAAQYELYGVLGAVLLLLTWFYLAGTIITVGGIVNAVLAGRPETDAESEPTEPHEERRADGPAPDIAELDREVEQLRERLDERTVDRTAIESDLERYVRRQLRRGHARDWGPYLVLLYGTGMTLGAFYFLSGGWAILAMLVVWLSTLGLYALMLVVGAGLAASDLPGRALDWVRTRRS